MTIDLDFPVCETLSRVRYAGATRQLAARADRGFYTHAIVAACRDQSVLFSVTIRKHQSLRNIMEATPEADWTPIPHWMEGAADVAENTYVPFASKPDAVPVRLIVRRVKPGPGSQLALFATYGYHAFSTDRAGDTLDLEADHRRHAEIENAIRDLKYGVGLKHLPSRRFPTIGAWLAIQVIGHNLARWITRIGLRDTAATTKTLRRHCSSLACRLTRPAPPHPASSPGLALAQLRSLRHPPDRAHGSACPPGSPITCRTCLISTPLILGQTDTTSSLRWIRVLLERNTVVLLTKLPCPPKLCFTEISVWLPSGEVRRPTER